MKLSFGKCWGLLFFDIVGLAISGYAFLLGYQVIMTLANANAYIILMGFFVGIKAIVLALYDLNRNLLRKNIPFIGGGITIIGNGIIFAMCFFLIPNVPLTFFIGLAIADFLIITLCHLLWWVLIGKDEDYTKEPKTSAKEERVPKKENKKAAKKNLKNEQKREPEKVDKNPGKKVKSEKKTWLSRDDEEESEYDSIFTSLLENEKRGQQRYVESPKADAPRIVEEEKRYQTSDFLNEIKENLKKENKIPLEPTAVQDGVTMKSVAPEFTPSPVKIPAGLPPMESVQKKKAGIESTPLMNNQPVGETIILPAQLSETTNPILLQNNNDLFGDLPTIKEKKPDFQKMETANLRASEITASEMGDNEEGFLSIERRLGYLFHEIEKSMKETQYLQGAISNFQKEVENYEPIAGDEKIVAAGNLIREKLKMIIDKQFVVDEVLDDLIRLSKLINKRINDLDVIEAGLNERKIALDQKDLLLVEARNRNPVEKEIEIMPEEVVLENLDSEFIVAEGDYESIRKYLTENQEE
ncbi:hypothetical protein [Acetobacterium sp.]|jgi:hypothetical protein|uniref:hypothetical protein n=1 Tax=Acetobacterium sp. TaxID=1872094 RepID=UPI000CB232DA|nr:hypothetical protein [Acetobacterium sp.]MDO9493548.1 hypothetical protein [Acetobacterium sp.]PKM75670.1 MAG: hypothetical protein CVU92_00245 [Firmicutes bacterium HGW-Firmicutes-17]